jgi:hypothetical protein
VVTHEEALLRAAGGSRRRMPGDHSVPQMGHKLPNMMAVHMAVDPAVRAVLADYTTMGDTGMGAMADMRMPGPRNSIAMQATRGPSRPSTWVACSG